ncbi:MAG: succinate dehydrogenase, hydrophobic membrane anchor protein [Proteobacteria bacterium]|nr:succinate dehydrogenase, hydrophobic membrane anchor protein [Pseudomonadota bacterium]
MSEGYRTDRSRVEGLGSAHHGAGTWIKERVSSIFLIPLAVWGLWSAYKLSGTGYDGAIAWLRSPLHAILLILTILLSVYHMRLGLRVVVEDYVHKPFGKGLFLLLNLLICLLLAVVAVFSILKIAFGSQIGV